MNSTLEALVSNFRVASYRKTLRLENFIHGPSGLLECSLLNFPVIPITDLELTELSADGFNVRCTIIELTDSAPFSRMLLQDTSFPELEDEMYLEILTYHRTQDEIATAALRGTKFPLNLIPPAQTYLGKDGYLERHDQRIPVDVILIADEESELGTWAYKGKASVSSFVVKEGNLQPCLWQAPENGEVHDMNFDLKLRDGRTIEVHGFPINCEIYTGLLKLPPFGCETDLEDTLEAETSQFLSVSAADGRLASRQLSHKRICTRYKFDWRPELSTYVLNKCRSQPFQSTIGSAYKIENDDWIFAPHENNNDHNVWLRRGTQDVVVELGRKYGNITLILTNPRLVPLPQRDPADGSQPSSRIETGKHVLKDAQLIFVSPGTRKQSKEEADTTVFHLTADLEMDIGDVTLNEDGQMQNFTTISLKSSELPQRKKQYFDSTTETYLLNGYLQQSVHVAYSSDYGPQCSSKIAQEQDTAQATSNTRYSVTEVHRKCSNSQSLWTRGHSLYKLTEPPAGFLDSTTSCFATEYKPCGTHENGGKQDSTELAGWQRKDE